jgi:hypothetical protein
VTTTSTPSARALRDLLDGGDRAVGGDQQRVPLLREPLDGALAEAVAVVGPRREEPVDVRAEPPQRPTRIAVEQTRRRRSRRGR